MFQSGVYQYGNMTNALRVIYQTEGARGLTCGLLPTLFRDAPFSGLYLMFFLQAKQYIPQEWLASSAAAPVNFSCGIAAGLMASVITQPFDVIKTKMQLYPEKFHGINSVIVHVHQVRRQFSSLCEANVSVSHYVGT